MMPCPRCGGSGQDPEFEGDCPECEGTGHEEEPITKPDLPSNIPRKTSTEGVAFIASKEGFVGHWYQDVADVWTIGFGHASKPGEYPTKWAAGITKASAFDLLAADCTIAEDAVNAHVKVALTQNQFDALVSFTFNLGGGAFAGSTLLKLLNQGDYQGAADEFPKWCHAAGVTNPTLQQRRSQERAVFLTP